MEKVKSIRNLLAKELPATSLIAYPLGVLILGHLLFDRIGVLYSIHVLQSTGSVMAGANPNDAISDGHVWAATALLDLLISWFVLLSLFRWMWAKTKGCLAFGHLSIARDGFGLSCAFALNHPA